VKVLQHAQIVVPDANRVFLFNEIDVVVPRVPDVVACSCKHVAQHVPVVQPTLFFKFKLVCNQVEGLGQVSGMRLVVVSNVVITLLNLLNKVQKLLVFDR
jgi:hypothetical protein